MWILADSLWTGGVHTSLMGRQRLLDVVVPWPDCISQSPLSSASLLQPSSPLPSYPLESQWIKSPPVPQESPLSSLVQSLVALSCKLLPIIVVWKAPENGPCTWAAIQMGGLRGVTASGFCLVQSCQIQPSSTSTNRCKTSLSHRVSSSTWLCLSNE